MDRRAAIRRGLELAKPGDVVLITGKGTDPYIMGPRGTKTPWNDAMVAHEELEKLKNAYLLWVQYYQILPKVHRFSLGQRIDALLIETIEATVTASFLSKSDKLPFVRLALRKIDTVKVLLLVLWESKSLDDKKFIALSNHFEEVGKMLGGWSGQLVKQNSPVAKTAEK